MIKKEKKNKEIKRRKKRTKRKQKSSYSNTVFLSGAMIFNLNMKDT